MIINFNKNNLDLAASPYLQQHKDNPINWQEWSPIVLEQAKKENKLLFLSVGYSTCQWCHAMANDAFADKQVADYLNQHYVCVKVDREERPDIDQYLLSFAIESQGAAGWPLNTMLTPDFKPIASFSYLPSKTVNDLPGFLDVAQKITAYYTEHKDAINPYYPTVPKDIPNILPTELMNNMNAQYDMQNGGFGSAPKFPPHPTLIFLLHYFEHTQDPAAYLMLKQTLDAMATGGLHDHLQGGFFRYCVDEQWRMPHFEKSLYDQALMLWVYSAAYKALKEPSYKEVAQRIMNCLHTSFEHDGLYSAALADTATDASGGNYLWTFTELQKSLNAKELEELLHIYTVPQFDPAKPIHLTKSRLSFNPLVEDKLLAIRNKRSLPFNDKTIITNWNALTGIGFIMAYRYLDDSGALEKAKTIFNNLIARHWSDGHLAHTSIDGRVQKQGFLQDYATMLLLATYIHEETRSNEKELTMLADQVRTFLKDGIWYETINDDFIPLPATIDDHSIPSSSAIADYALKRTALLLNQEIKPEEYKPPLIFDFHNVATFLSLGNVHIIDTPSPIIWGLLPINAIQRSGEIIKDCIGNECRSFDSPAALLDSLIK